MITAEITFDFRQARIRQEFAHKQNDRVAHNLVQKGIRIRKIRTPRSWHFVCVFLTCHSETLLLELQQQAGEVTRSFRKQEQCDLIREDAPAQRRKLSRRNE
ncbi:hypothetical protein EAI_08270 [Harpegnathos saltator]|uniref:Uncharacterized protein n=1 Tax=Harpegnathos saltator TaxID=610380 RepID=E2CAC3_HARSA|nr:hypothetical protein EAI_08270 [Harpegnathos saltator]